MQKRKQTVEVDNSQSQSESDGELSESEANDKIDTEIAATVNLVDKDII